MEKPVRQIADRYVVRKVIGQGAMGRVFECEDRKMARSVAIKELLTEASDIVVERFHNEARTTAALRHENILTVSDFGISSKGTLYLVMDLLEGESLLDFILARDRLETDQALPIFQQCCRGFQHAHENGVLHRDIKPSNVMLVRNDSDEPQVRIVDFGLAKREGADQSLTATGYTVGTPAYMSPEAVCGDSLDERSDIYSFGCLMFHTLTGDCPFESERIFDVMVMHKDKQAPSLSEACGGKEFPELLETIVARCLEKKRQARYGSFRELNAALDELKDQLESEAALEPLFEPEPEEVSPQPEKSGIALAPSTILMIAFLAASLFSLYMWAQDVINPARTFKHKTADRVTDNFQLAVSTALFVAEDGSVQAWSFITDDGLKAALPSYSERKRWNLEKDGITDRGISYLAKLPIESLRLSELSIGDAALGYISRMSKLESLDIENCPAVTDRGVASLSSSPQLSKIALSGAGIDGNVCSQLAKIEKLTSIRLSDVALTPEDVGRLQQLQSLRKLAFSRVHVTRKLSEELALLPRLSSLGLEKACSIDEGALEPLAGSRSLETLMLFRAKISGQAAVAELSQLHNVSKILLMNMDGISRKQIVALRKKLPRAKIERWETKMKDGSLHPHRLD